jgi:hypothetical protein
MIVIAKFFPVHSKVSGRSAFSHSDLLPIIRWLHFVASERTDLRYLYAFSVILPIYPIRTMFYLNELILLSILCRMKQIRAGRTVFVKQLLNVWNKWIFLLHHIININSHKMLVCSRMMEWYVISLHQFRGLVVYTLCGVLPTATRAHSVRAILGGGGRLD